MRSSRSAAFALVIAIFAGVLSGCGDSPSGGTFVTPSASAPSAPAPGASAPVTGGKPSAWGDALPAFAPAPAPKPITLTSNGPVAPMLSRLPVTQKVAFLTMDDGQVRLPVAPQLMQAAHVPFTMFLIAPVAAGNPAFFKQMQAAGGVIEDHTLTHASLRGKSYAFQRNEICGAKNRLQTTFGVHPRFFRPPYGNYDTNTLKAVHDCGLQAAFNWSETVNEGKVRYQTAVHKIQPGDIILMHFRPAFVKDVEAALKAIHDSGLTPALLEDYIK